MRNKKLIFVFFITLLFADLALQASPALRTLNTACPALRTLNLISSPAFALSNSADAFMSLPFGHNFKRTQLRMERSGAQVMTPRPDSLLMTGYFEGYQTEFTFTFYKKNLLKSKAAYLKSTGSQSRDKNFYELLKKGFEQQYGSGKEMPVENSLVKGRIMMKNTWTPDRYTTITLIYNSEATKRFPGNSVKDRPIHIIYYYNKWDKN